MAMQRIAAQRKPVQGKKDEKGNANERQRNDALDIKIRRPPLAGGEKACETFGCPPPPFPLPWSPKSRLTGGWARELVNASPGASGAFKEPQDGPKGPKQSAKIVQESVETAKGSPTTVQDNSRRPRRPPRQPKSAPRGPPRGPQRGKIFPFPWENVHF